MKRRWNAALHSLVLVRLGQELGTDSELAHAIAGGIDVALRIFSSLLVDTF
jgi:hypothetical protein